MDNFSSLNSRLCLDFANTVSWHASDHPKEQLKSYADLVSWSKTTGLLTESDAQHLSLQAEQRPAEANSVLQQAIVLREAIYRIFSATAHGLNPQTTDVEVLNDALSKAFTRLRLVATGKGFTWEWVEAQRAMDRMLWPIAKVAAELLTSGELNKVRQCANDLEGCGWLFLDMSKNRSRRWCDMKDCGNRAKVRRYYERRRTKWNGDKRKLEPRRGFEPL